MRLTRRRAHVNLMAQPDANHYDCLFYRNPGADTRLRPEELDVELLRTTRASTSARSASPTSRRAARPSRR